MSTLKDIARHLDISHSTVSRAFDPSSRVSNKTRRRVLEYAAEIGYCPNLIARSLKRHETKTVGIIIPDLENVFYIEVLQRIEFALKNCGYRLLISFLQSGVTTERECLDLMAASQVDAIIILPSDSTNREYVLRLSRQIRLIQLFTPAYPEIDSVVMNDVAGAAMGGRYLLNRGHRRILYLGGADRVEGFRAALKEYGVSESEALIHEEWADVEQVAVMLRDYKPTAVFAIAWESEVAWTAMRTLNLAIRDDISFLAYDNTKWNSMLGITAIAHNLENVASMLVDQLMFRLTTPAASTAPARHTVLDPYIKERQSVKLLTE